MCACPFFCLLKNSLKSDEHSIWKWVSCTISTLNFLPGTSCSIFQIGSLPTDLCLCLSTTRHLSRTQKSCVNPYFTNFLQMMTHIVKSKTLGMSFSTFTFWPKHKFSSLTVEVLRVRRLGDSSYFLIYLLLLSTELRSMNCVSVWLILAYCFNRQASQILLSPLVTLKSERCSNLSVDTWKCLIQTEVHLMLIPIL